SPAASPGASPAASPSPVAKPTAAPAAAPSGTLTIDLSADVESLDPYLAYENAGLSVHHNLFDYLVERDFDGKLAPGLAESWRVAGAATLEFKLRQGVTFHNGEPFTADA